MQISNRFIEFSVTKSDAPQSPEDSGALAFILMLATVTVLASPLAIAFYAGVYFF